MYLFVYGTLLSSVPSSMSKFLRRRATLVGEATVSGRLYDLGRYPGFQIGGGKVTGELYLLEEKRQQQTIEMLDAYEGVAGEAEDEYVRTGVKCTLANGTTVEADTYVSRSLPSQAARIVSGDYAKFYVSSIAHQEFVNGV
ncbi:gamma-glutamylcyclotransferase [Lewinella sp. 4G2]|uniref:gamma-glutamylcyclotransferase family protein n=1 Tax=Lewinella sp. 4G2 TaxID=1803372 RepID=UPI0007B470A9|nr:gamma-glutamylcyclotransferase family protein [Lewinella sp. 4G2]OAV44699.1 hypothetical protein A3850_009440 [Lewinella sp. 4G2]